ncbi:hypothetical protein ACOZ38_36820 [Sphaerisporangium viridialbum]|uniref:hypothetical protein n=1 Tax=Sphaerisporangium viridialbum TaxID=46189 RepID=UPI003C73EAB7
MFSSGPHVSCYQARSTVDGAVIGIRCVKFANLIHQPGTPGIAFVWYGEGTDDAGPYRYFGEAFSLPGSPDDVSGSVLIALAGGLSGNGERAEPLLELRFEVGSPAGGVPAKLRVTGDRSEEWTLVPNGVLAGYQPVPRRIAKAGPNFHEFVVRKHDGTPGVGVRLMLHSGSWLGSGRWGDMTYLHLGTFVGDPANPVVPVRFGTADIGIDTHYCGFVPWGEMSVRRTSPATWQVTGAWSEEWQERHAGPDRPVDPRIAGLTVLR